MPTIDFIYFDLGKVILEFDHDVGCQQVSDVTGVSPENVKSALFDSGLEDRYETGLVNCSEFHAEFCKLTNSDSNQQEFLTATSDIFTPNLAMFPLISQLSASKFPIGILSNTCKAHWELVYAKYIILRQFFSPVILSYEVNSMKPDAAIYGRAIEMAGCQPNKCFFVDDKQENVDGAIEAGIDAVLYRSVPELAKELSQRGISINF